MHAIPVRLEFGFELDGACSRARRAGAWSASRIRDAGLSRCSANSLHAGPVIRPVRALSIMLAAASMACGLTLFVLGPFPTLPTRQILWQYVRACVVDFELTGHTFPCLFVDLTGERELG